MILKLQKLWINLIDTGQGLAFYSGRDKNLDRSMDGEVRKYANGRLRAISSKGVKGTFSFELIDVTQAQLDTLERWLSQHVVLRDVRGRRFFGVFFGLSISDKRTVTYYNVTITLGEVTYTEGV